MLSLSGMIITANLLAVLPRITMLAWECIIPTLLGVALTGEELIPCYTCRLKTNTQWQCDCGTAG